MSRSAPDTFWEEWCPFLFRLHISWYFLSTSYENSLQTTFLFQVNTFDIIWWWSKQPAWRWFCKVLHRPDQQVRNYFSCSCNDFSWPNIDPPPQTSLHHIEREVSFSLLFLTLGLYRSFFSNKISGPTVLIYITCEKNYQKKF